MSDLRSLLLALVALPALGNAAESPIVSTFAKCAGKLSAELEHAWLMSDSRSAQIAAQRRQFVDLLEASSSPGSRPEVLHWRIEAKVAHAQLLRQATFSQDGTTATWALQRAAFAISDCTAFLIKS